MPNRFLSRREKKPKAVVVKPNDGRRDIYNLFHWTENRKTTREEDKSITEIAKRLETADISDIYPSHIEYAIRWTGGHTDIAHELCVLLHDTSAVELRPIDPEVSMIGAENRDMVTCYIDSLLFAMFARMDSFESVLSVEFPDHATNTLAHALRYWVNMLRSGRLITTDITKFIQESLAECGWTDARRLAQQDVSEAFSFITDKLALPLLTLKMDVYHTGKDDQDDHRIVKERLLEVAIPDPPEDAPEDGYTIKLEDCLENYFNNQIEVKRHLQRRNTVNYGQSRLPKVRGLQEESSAERSDSRGSIFRHRQVAVNEESAISEDQESPSTTARDDIDLHLGRKITSGSAIFRKEVLMPAWQFFHLIPWSTNKHKPDAEITTDAQVAAHFATKKPVLGICLKRYSAGQGHFKRLNTYVDIPLEIKLPHFFSDGTEDDGFGSSFSRFKLSLQSVICHRGVVLEMGHYISLVRPSAEEASCEVEEGQPDPKYQWFMHDDLQKDRRVTRVDIRKALRDETPYLVFYQIQPIDEFDELDEFPPTYAEATGAAPTPGMGSPSTTMSLASSASLSTVLGTEPAASPPLRAVINNVEPAATPLSLANGTGPQVVLARGTLANRLIIPQNKPHTVAAAKDLASNAESEAIKLDVSKLTSSLNEATIISLNIPRTSQPTSRRASHELESNRHSYTTSIPSILDSEPITPGENAKSSEEFVTVENNAEPSAVEINQLEQTSVVQEIGNKKRSWLKLSKAASVEDSAKESSEANGSHRWHHSSRNWLGGSSNSGTSGTGTTKSKSRPNSQAAHGSSGFKRIKDVMSREKLADAPHTAGQTLEETSEQHATEGAANSGDGDASPADSAASFTYVIIGKEKHAPARVKSGRGKKGKGKRESNGVNTHVLSADGVDVGGGNAAAGSDDSNGDRQCALM